MKGRLRWLLVLVPVLAALVAAGTLGVASGEGPVGSTAARSVSVEGVGTVPIGNGDTAAQATASYREGMAKALADAQAKAAFLAEKAGGSTGAAVSIVEDGGYIECSAPGSEYFDYEGEQPDFGYGRSPTIAAAPENALSKSAPAPTVSHRPKVKRRHKARKATAVHCSLTANVSVVYGLA